MMINMIGTERHLPWQHCSRHRACRELIVRKERRNFRLNTVAFFSSTVEKTDKYCKWHWGKGGRGGLTDVETGGVTWLADKLVCCFKLAVNVFRGGIWRFVYGSNRPAFLERDLMGLGVNGNWQVWVRYCSGEVVSIHTVRKGTAGLTLIVPSANSVLLLEIAVANRLMHANLKNSIVYLFL